MENIDQNRTPFSGTPHPAPGTPAKPSRHDDASLSAKPVRHQSMVQTPNSSSVTGMKTPARSQSLILTPNTAREAAKLSKMRNTEEKRRKTLALKEKWAKEKEEKLEQFQKRKEEERLVQQRIEKLVTSQRQRDLQKKREVEKAKRMKEKESLQLSLEAHRQMKEDLARQARERRRRSVLINKEILFRAKDREAKLKQQQKEEEESLLTSRRIDFLAVRDQKVVEAELRRQSMAMRVEESIRQSEVEKELKRQEHEKQVNLLETRREGWLDEKEFHEMQRERKRESLAGRLETWREHRQLEMLQKEEEKDSMLHEFEVKKLCWLDEQEEKTEKAKRDRLSLQWRRDKYHEEKDLEEEMKRRRDQELEVERQLLQQEYEDVLMYQAEQEALRRQSLAYRLDAAARDRDYMAGQDANKHAVVAHEMQLRRQDFLDLKAFREGFESERRKSLAMSLEKAREERAYMTGLRQEELERIHEEEKIHSEEHKDVERYKAELRNQERAEIAARIEASRREKEVDLEAHRVLMDRMHEEYEERRENWKLLQEEKVKEKERSRKSICLRLGSWKETRMKREKDRARMQLIAEQDSLLKSQDMASAAEAKRKEMLQEKLNDANRMIF